MQKMDRRAFIRNATLGAATILGAGALAGCSQNESAPTGDSADKPAEPAPAPAAAAPAPAAAPKNRVCEILGIEKPVISAPMYSLTNGEFVAAVSSAGGLGMLNATALSDKEVFPDTDELYRLAEQELNKIRELTDKPFGVVVPGSVPGMKELILDVMPAIIIPNDFSPSDIYDLRDAGIKIFGSIYDAELDVIRQSMAECDIAYLKCYGCGGSIPTNRANMVAIMQKFAALDSDTPIVPGGGIVNAVGAAAAVAAGAEGVWVGTRFLATNESPMSDVAKKMLVELESANMVEINFGAAYNHCNPSMKALDYINALGADPKSNPGAMDLYMESLGTYTFGMRAGDMDNWYLSVNDSVDAITEITSAKAVVDELGDAVLAAQALLAK